MTRDGFTLIELLATLVFISIVAGTLLGLFISAARQQHHANELELARAWLLSELALQRIEPLIGSCQATSPFQNEAVTCLVASDGTLGTFATVRITLIDNAAQPVRSVASVVGIAGAL